jgi:hypothetical protein
MDKNVNQIMNYKLFHNVKLMKHLKNYLILNINTLVHHNIHN